MHAAKSNQQAKLEAKQSKKPKFYYGNGSIMIPFYCTSSAIEVVALYFTSLLSHNKEIFTYYWERSKKKKEVGIYFFQIYRGAGPRRGDGGVMMRCHD